ncbi:MAG: FHA domain-containing protein [Chloroflexota bacterium]|jgi:hypothetical protein
MTATVVLALRIGLAVLLYVFLWRVIQTLWRDINGQSALILSQKAPGIHVSARPENGAETNYHFRQSEIIIGRSSNCDISLKDEALSARHARLSFHHGQWWLEDLGSTNGTFLNQDRIKVPAVVITGDQFQCGDTFFSLRIDPIPTSIQTKQIGEQQ